MDSNEKQNLLNILRQLESVRDILFEQNDATPQSNLFCMQANIFTSTYFFNFTRLIETKIDTTDDVYLEFAKSRIEATRYLLELCLTFAHFVAMGPESRFNRSYSFLLSGKLSIHRLDLKNLELASIMNLDQEPVITKLEINRNGYRLMLNEYGRLNEKMPDEIDNFFTGTDLVHDIKNTFDIDLFPHSKIVYTREISENPLIPDTNNIRDIIKIIYPLLSIDAHPTPASLIDFELFIKKTLADKQFLVQSRNSATGTFLKVIGELFLTFASILMAEKKPN